MPRNGKNMKEHKIKSALLYRNTGFEIQSNGDQIESFIDQENRTVTLSFASTEPVEREFGMEILDHGEDSVNLSRLQKAGPVLVNHNRDDVVGIVEKVWIENGRSYSQIRFGRSARATEVFNDVVDGIRRTVSFGYRVKELVKSEERSTKNVPTYIATDWEPYEISLEVLPADPTVGIGRSEEDNAENTVVVKENNIPIVEVKKEKRTMSDKTNERLDGIKAERKRLNSLRKTADQVRHLFPEVDALVEDFSNSERTMDEFNAALVAKMNEVKTPSLESRSGEAEIGMSDNDLADYSLTRLVNAMATGNYSDAGLELEASRAYADMVGNEARGAYVPFDVLSQTRTTTSSGAGSLIATDFWGQSYIDVLRNNSVVVGMGAQVIPGLVGDVDIPKASNEIGYTWINNETTDGGLTDLTSGAVNLSPTTITGGVGLTRKMLKQTGNPAIEAIVRNQMNAGIGVAIDTAALVGAGTGAIPAGITTFANVVEDASALDWAAIVGLESRVAGQNADLGSLGYVCSSASKGDMKTTLRDAGVSGYLMADNGTVNGYQCGVTNILSDTMMFGNFNDLMIPMWGGIDIELDKVTLGARGGLVMRVFLDADVKARRVESFAQLTNLT